jgi:pyruvate kinase
MKRARHVKIVATLGPASEGYDMIRKLYEAGADVFRLNMSHGGHDEIRARHAAIRQVEKDIGRPIAILADLQGPKLRCGSFANGEGYDLEDGASFRFDLDPTPGDAGRVQLPHKEIFDALEPGSRLLVNDGKVRLRVDACGADFADCTVVAGGPISNRKGVNVPDVVLPLAALSDKDRKDLEFVCQLGVDWLALSFVQRAADVEEARGLAKGRAAILSKIEKPAAVQAFDEILAVSDGIMVARGDLGVELPVHAVPPIQKRLVRKCRAAAKPVIVATQMLESMIESPMPTRAEVSDVATALYEGRRRGDAERGIGRGRLPDRSRHHDAQRGHRGRKRHQFPRHHAGLPRGTAQFDRRRHRRRGTGDRRDRRHQGDLLFHAIGQDRRAGGARTPARADHRADAAGGRGAAHVPDMGIACFMTEEQSRFKGAVVSAARAARSGGYASEEDQIIVVAGVPFNVQGSTNILRVAPCAERLIYATDPE